MSFKVSIKNMVCPRCITAVQNIFEELNIHVLNIALGEVFVESSISKDVVTQLKIRLQEEGFELLEDKSLQLITQIKSILIDHIHHQQSDLKQNYSDLLSEKLNSEYSTLSKLFSSIEGITIERFIVKQKIERVKQLLYYNQLSLSEIAFQMHYSSVAHLSAQFKRETGMTPTAFKKTNRSGYLPLDSI